MALGYRDQSGLRDHEEENIAPQNPANSFGELLFLLRSRQRLSLRSPRGESRGDGVTHQ